MRFVVWQLLLLLLLLLLVSALRSPCRCQWCAVLLADLRMQKQGGHSRLQTSITVDKIKWQFHVEQLMLFVMHGYLHNRKYTRANMQFADAGIANCATAHVPSLTSAFVGPKKPLFARVLMRMNST
jgi:membrane-associated PAP2 superfamily phosphatase